MLNNPLPYGEWTKKSPAGAKFDHYVSGATSIIRLSNRRTWTVNFPDGSSRTRIPCLADAKAIAAQPATKKETTVDSFIQFLIGNWGVLPC
jgi:hypothetical protein